MTLTHRCSHRREECTQSWVDYSQPVPTLLINHWSTLLRNAPTFPATRRGSLSLPLTPADWFHSLQKTSRLNCLSQKLHPTGKVGEAPQARRLARISDVYYGIYDVNINTIVHTQTLSRYVHLQKSLGIFLFLSYCVSNKISSFTGTLPAGEHSFPFQFLIPSKCGYNLDDLFNLSPHSCWGHSLSSRHSFLILS